MKRGRIASTAAPALSCGCVIQPRVVAAAELISMAMIRQARIHGARRVAPITTSRARACEAVNGVSGAASLRRGIMIVTDILKLRICPRCKQRTLDNASYGESGIYRSRHRLCVPCWHDEEAETDKAGTNNLPETLAAYGPENDYD